MGRGCARSVRVGAHGLLKLIQSSGVVGADDGSGEILIGWNLMRVEQNAIVLLWFEIEDGEIAGAFVIGLSQGVRRIVHWLSLLKSERAIGVCRHVEKNIADAEIVFVGFFAAVEVGALDFEAQVRFEVYATAFEHVAVCVEEAAAGRSGNVLEDVVADRDCGGGEAPSTLGFIDVKKERVELVDRAGLIGDEVIRTEPEIRRW